MSRADESSRASPPPSGGEPPGVERAYPSDAETVLQSDSPGARTAPEYADFIARSLPGYQFLGEIRRGGQGVVCLARQTGVQRQVAIKILKAGPFAEAADRARFEREIHILGQLRHPNIVTIYECGMAGGHFYFVMDYIEGRGLDDWLKARGQRSGSAELNETLRLFAAICKGVQAAHDRGIVHRDLKPSNIRIGTDGSPHVLDFGLARAAPGTAGTENEMDAVTHTGQFMGSMPWSSPEQVEGAHGNIDARTDVYSLGVILYQMLMGRFPYGVTGSNHEVMENILRATPQRPSALVANLPADLETIVLKCLNKERGRRYADAGQLAGDIECFLADEPISAKRDSVLYVLRSRGRSLIRRHRVLSMLAVIPISYAATEWIGVPLITEWTGADRMFERALTSAPLLASTRGMKWVRNIVVPSGEALAKFAKQQGVPGVSEDDPHSFRRLHGYLMERLADCGASVIVWDIGFREASDYDNDLVKGIDAVKNAGTPVIVAVPDWWLGKHDLPAIASSIKSKVQVGGVTANVDELPWRVDLAARRGNDRPLPSISLLAVACMRHPGTSLQILMDNSRVGLLLHYEQTDSQGVVRSVAKDDEVSFAYCETRPADSSFAGLQAGDRVGFLQLDMPASAVRRDAACDYEEALKAPSSRLRRLFRGKAIVIGLGAGSPDMTKYADGTLVPGCFDHALAVEQIMTAIAGNVRPPTELNRVFDCLAVVAGWIISLLFVRVWFSVAASGVCMAAAVAFSILAARSEGILYDPLVAIFGLAVTVVIAKVVRTASSRADSALASANAVAFQGNQ